MSVCEEDCDFTDYNYTTGKAICSCKVKVNSTTKIGDIIIDKDKLYNSFTNLKNIANINVLKCYKLIFQLDAFKYNYANLIMICIILLFLVTLITFICKDYYNQKKIIDIMVYFKIHQDLVKQFLAKQKEEELKKQKEIQLNQNKKRKRK